jgi:hypothetical protein
MARLLRRAIGDRALDELSGGLLFDARLPGSLHRRRAAVGAAHRVATDDGVMAWSL